MESERETLLGEGKTAPLFVFSTLKLTVLGDTWTDDDDDGTDEDDDDDDDCAVRVVVDVGSVVVRWLATSAAVVERGKSLTACAAGGTPSSLAADTPADEDADEVEIGGAAGRGLNTVRHLWLYSGSGSPLLRRWYAFKARAEVIASRCCRA